MQNNTVKKFYKKDILKKKQNACERKQQQK